MAQKIIPNLWFDTEAEEAAAFYVRRLQELAHRERRPLPGGRSRERPARS